MGEQVGVGESEGQGAVGCRLVLRGRLPRGGFSLVRRFLATRFLLRLRLLITGLLAGGDDVAVWDFAALAYPLLLVATNLLPYR